jgi:hypothetical protein
MADEINWYIDAAYEHEKMVKLEDVHVTDHKPVPQKRVT